MWRYAFKAHLNMLRWLSAGRAWSSPAKTRLRRQSGKDLEHISCLVGLSPLLEVEDAGSQHCAKRE
jgi:hypothetical protein